MKPIRDYDVYVDKTMEFKVVKINQEFRNVVVSHKALIEAELEAQKQVIMSKLEKGQILEGTVKNITSYGVFVDLGGVDGLIHITDLSWGRVNHPRRDRFARREDPRGYPRLRRCQEAYRIGSEAARSAPLGGAGSQPEGGRPRGRARLS